MLKRRQETNTVICRGRDEGDTPNVIALEYRRWAVAAAAHRQL